MLAYCCVDCSFSSVSAPEHTLHNNANRWRFWFLSMQTTCNVGKMNPDYSYKTSLLNAIMLAMHGKRSCPVPTSICLAIWHCNWRVVTPMQLRLSAFLACDCEAVTHAIVIDVCPSVKRVDCDKTKAPSKKVQLWLIGSRPWAFQWA